MPSRTRRRYLQRSGLAQHHAPTCTAALAPEPADFQTSPTGILRPPSNRDYSRSSATATGGWPARMIRAPIPRPSLRIPAPRQRHRRYRGDLSHLYTCGASAVAWGYRCAGRGAAGLLDAHYDAFCAVHRHAWAGAADRGQSRRLRATHRLYRLGRHARCSAVRHRPVRVAHRRPPARKRGPGPALRVSTSPISSSCPHYIVQHLRGRASWSWIPRTRSA